MERWSDLKKVRAVLTGDVVGSTHMSETEMERFRAIVSSGGLCLGRPPKFEPPDWFEVDFFRGDSWQILLEDPRSALRCAVYIKALLYGEMRVKTRISIGVGRVEFISRQSVSLSLGEAFVLSGRALDGIGRAFHLTGAMPRGAGVLANWFPAVLRLCDGSIRSWTPRQAQFIAKALEHPDATHEKIAAMMNPPVSKQVVSSSLRSAQWRELTGVVDVFEATDWDRALPGAS